MTIYQQTYLSKLKELVLEKLGIAEIVPADCGVLSMKINMATTKRVSETTLKRVFGFTSSIYQPSIYTLNALAKYCGFDGWESFCLTMEQANQPTATQLTWSRVKLSAARISAFTIRGVKQKCGIPYSQTIDREHMGLFMTHFLRSGATIGILSGGTGHGKTIAVSRWVESQMEQNNKSAEQPIFLFTNGHSLLQSTVYGYHVSHWLSHILRLDSVEMLDDFMENHVENTAGNFYLLIDELNANSVTERQFRTLITQLNELVRHFAHYSWFRVVFVLRTCTLLKYRSLFEDTVINPHWFSIFSEGAGEKKADMPAFSARELNRIANGVNQGRGDGRFSFIAHNNVIRIPLFFQYYLEQCGRPDICGISRYDEYRIITRFMKRNVFDGVGNATKLSLLAALAPLIEDVCGTQQISLKKAHGAVNKYWSAYADLLHAGMLCEYNSGRGTSPDIVIRFLSRLIPAYIAALHLMNREYDTVQLIELLDRSAFSGDARMDQLRWLLIFHIERGDLQLADQVGNIPFIGEDLQETVAFICDILGDLSNTASEGIQDMLNSRLQGGLFVEHALRYTSFRVEHTPSLAKLLAFKLSETHEIILRSKLAVVALLKWEEDALLEQLEKLASIPMDAYTNLVVNPLKALSLLHCYFRGEVSDELAFEMTKIPYRVPPYSFMGAAQLFDLLIYCWVKMTGNAHAAKSYCHFIRQKLALIAHEQTFERDFTAIIYALYLLECGEPETAAAHVAQTSVDHLNQPVYRVLHHIFDMQHEKLSGDGNFRERGRLAVSICEIHGLKLLETCCRTLILDDLHGEERTQYINQLRFQHAAFGIAIGPHSIGKKCG